MCLLCRFELQNHPGLQLADPRRKSKRQLHGSPRKTSGGWWADANCTEPSTDGVGGLRPRKQSIGINANDSSNFFLWQVKGMMDGNQGFGAELEQKGTESWEAIRSQGNMLLGFRVLAWVAVFEQSRNWSWRGARGRHTRTWIRTGRGNPILSQKSSPFPQLCPLARSLPSC